MPPQKRNGGVTSGSEFENVMQLRLMREKDPAAKALVFSQFVGTIEWLKVKLQERGFGYRFISGSMPLKQRTQVNPSQHQDPSLHVV